MIHLEVNISLPVRRLYVFFENLAVSVDNWKAAICIGSSAEIDSFSVKENYTVYYSRQTYDCIPIIAKN